MNEYYDHPPYYLIGMNSIFSIEFASNALISIFSVNLIIHLLILFQIINLPSIFSSIDAHISPIFVILGIICFSFLLVLLTLIKAEMIQWRINNSILTFIFGFVCFVAFLGSIYLISEFRFLPLVCSLTVAICCWKLTQYPQEHLN